MVDRRLSFIFALAASMVAPALALASAGITYHGRLMKSDGTPVEESVVQFRIQIRSPGNENCLMYQETHTRDMTGTSGVFAITINDGTATSVNTEPFTLDRVFQNRGTFSFVGTKCALGSVYNPAGTDGRRLFVDFNDGTFAGFEALPSQAINFVPMALESMTVGGYGSGSMLRVNDGTGAPASISALTQTQYSHFLDLLAGTSTSYLTASSALDGAQLTNGTVTDAKLASGISGAKISGNISGNAAGFTGSLSGDVTGTQSATVVGKIQGRAIDSAAPTNGQVLKWNNGNSRWEPSSDNAGTGTVTSVNGTGAVQMTGTAADPIVGVRDASTSAKGVVQLASSADTAANLVVQSNDTRLTDSRTPVAHHHGVDEIDSAASKYFGYKPNNVACSNGELLKWNSAQTRWECGTASSSESTTVSNIGSAGIGVYKQLTGSNIELKKINAASNITLTDDTTNNKIDVAVNLGGVFANNTGLIVSDGTQLQNKACSANQVLKWLSPTGWTCAADDGLTSETDPKVGSNTLNYVSKWNGSALVAGGIYDDGTNIGIGTSSPTVPLTVTKAAGTLVNPGSSTVAHFIGPDGSSARIALESHGTTNSQPVLMFKQSRGTNAAPTATQSGDPIGTLATYGYGATAFTGRRSNIWMFATENWTDTAGGSNMVIETTNNGAATATEKFRIEQNGNVGIGSAAPLAALEVARGSSPGTPATTGTATTALTRLHNTNTNAVMDIGGMSVSPYSTWIQTTDVTNLSLTYPLALQPNGGYVGIGTTNPIGQFEVQSTLGTQPRGVISSQYSADSSSARFSGLKARGTPASPAAVQADDNLAIFAAYGHDGSTFGAVQAGFAGFNAAENYTTSAHGSYFVIGTAPTGGTTASERVRVNAAGNVGIGTNNPSAKLHIGGTAGVDGIKFPDGTVQTTAAGAAGSATFVDVSRNAALTAACNADTKITYDTKAEDTANLYNTSTGRLTPTAGIWKISASVFAYTGSGESNQHFAMALYKNGSVFKYGPAFRDYVANSGAQIDVMIHANGTDYYELYVQFGNCTAAVAMTTSASVMWMQAAKIGN